MQFADFIGPVSEEQFFSDYYGRRPLVVPADGNDRRRNVLDWAELNRLLSIRSHWTTDNLQLVLNSRPVLPEHFSEGEAQGGGARRASLAKVNLFLGMGASLVANGVEEVSPAIRGLTDMLGGRLGGLAGANAYCSFDRVRAFASHCDPHEVFAIQCEGEKTWRIYSNRADNPTEMLHGADAQAIIDASKGPVLQEVTLRPGDLLYLPRGYYHDALATGQSLHLTFALMPFTGRLLFRLLEGGIGREDSAFRAYLPDGRADRAVLKQHLSGLAERIGETVKSDAFAELLIREQRRLTAPSGQVGLPERPALEHYAATGRRAQLNGRTVETGEGPAIDAGGLAEVAAYMLGSPAYSVQELLAAYPWAEEAEVRRLVGEFVRAGLSVAYTPQV